MGKIEQPIALFKKWFNEELKLTTVKVPTAVCLSTIGIDGYPNARLVSLKEIVDDSFIITGAMNSRKGIEISQNANAALTFWWTETERQVRVQGLATKISEELAEKYFQERGSYSRAVSIICEQGQETSDIEQLGQKVLEKATEDQKLERPKYWGGFSIKPMRIEFMNFDKTRFHDRKLYELTDDGWSVKQLQP